MKDLREMDSCRPANPVAMLDELRVIATPLRLLNWKAELRRHPRPALRSFSCVRSGTGIPDRVLAWPMSLRELEVRNMLSEGQHPESIKDYLSKEVCLGRTISPLSDSVTGVHINRFGFIPKSTTEEVEVDHRLLFVGGNECQ